MNVVIFFCSGGEDSKLQDGKRFVQRFVYCFGAGCIPESEMISLSHRGRSPVALVQSVQKGCNLLNLFIADAGSLSCLFAGSCWSLRFCSAGMGASLALKEKKMDIIFLSL